MVNCIRISVAEGDAPPEQINLRFVGGRNERILQVPLPNTFVSEEIRWYLEDFAQHNPSEKERAADAEAALIDHAKQLGFYISFSAVLNELVKGEPMLLVEVEDSSDMPAAFHWEALERPKVLDLIPHIKSAMVTRIFTDVNDIAGTGPTEIGFQTSDGRLNILNVLIVSARADLEADISHRLVAGQALKGLNTIVNVQPMIKELTHVEVIHPATFDSLAAHLSSRKPGFFALVHFDLHGSDDGSGNVKLEFIKGIHIANGHFTCVVDRRSVQEVGQLLQEHQVNRVVLTACRSTRHAGAEGTIPRVLRDYGVLEVVAMSYQVLSRCVQNFTIWFYATLFATRSIPYAVHFGRKSIAYSPERLSRLGTKTQIADDVVPVCYRSQGWLNRKHIAEIAGDFSDVKVQNDDIEDEPMVGLGREHDLLKLECMLLEGGRPVIVVGEPGIGKTVLLNMLGEWWDSTGCAIANRYFQLSLDPDFTIDKMCRTLHMHFNLPGAYAGQQSIIPALRAKRYLIIIDSLESLSSTTAKSAPNQNVALLKFVRALRGAKTILVLGSRREPSFLASYTFNLPISGLKIVPAMQLIRHMIKASWEQASKFRSIDSRELLARGRSLMNLEVAESDTDDLLKEIEDRKQQKDVNLFAKWDSDEDGIYLEEILKLVNGHPMALAIIIHNMWMLGPDVTPKRYMLGLLEGAPMITDLTSMLGDGNANIEGFRSLTDLQKMVNDLQTELPFAFKQMIGTLATFWGAIPVQDLELFQKFEVKEYSNSGDRNKELLGSMDLLESAGAIKEIPSDLKRSLNRLKSDSIGTLEARRIHLQAYEYMDSQGFMEKMPHMRSVLQAMRETFSTIPDVDPAVLQFNETMNSHEGFFLFQTIRETLLAMPSGTNEEMKTVIRSWSSWDDFCAAGAEVGPANELMKTLSLARSAILRPGLKALIASQLLRFPEDPLGPGEDQTKVGPARAYIRTSPLLTIMLRGHGVWSQDEKTVASHRTALTLLYAHRSRAWPASSPNSNSEAWRTARVETDVEFYNLASAVALGRAQLQKKSLGIFIDEAISHATMKLDWHNFHERIRAPVVQMLWESCLDDALESAKALEDSKGRPQKRAWPARLTSKTSEESIPLELRQTELRLFARRNACILLAMCLLNFYNKYNDTRTRRCVTIIKDTTGKIRKDSYPLKVIQTALESNESIHDLNLKILKSLGITRLSKQKQVSQNIADLVEAHLASTSPSRDTKESHSSSDQPQSQNDSPTFLSISTKVQDNTEEIHRLVQTRKYDEARELLDTTIELELDSGRNQPGHLSTLYFFRSIVNAKQGRLSDAIKDLEDYRRLNKSSGQELSITYMSRMTSFMRHSLTWVLEMEAKSKVHQDTRLLPCGNCYKRKGTRRCLGCLYMLYCSAECQKKHWGTHKKVCKKIGSGYSI